MHAARARDDREETPAPDPLFPSANRSEGDLRLDLSTVDFGESRDNKLGVKEYVLAVPGDSKSGIVLSEELRKKSATLWNTGSNLISSMGKEKAAAELRDFLSDQGLIPIQMIGGALGSVGTAAFSIGALAGEVSFIAPVVLATLTAAAALLPSPLFWDVCKRAIAAPVRAIRRELTDDNPEFEAEKIERSLDTEIKLKNVTEGEREELIKEIASDLQARSKIYEALANAIEKSYAEVKEIRHQGVRESLLGTREFAEKTGAAKSLPEKIEIDLTQITTEPKLCEELTSFSNQVLGLCR